MRKGSDSSVNQHSWQVVQYRSGHSHCSAALAMGVFVPLPWETVFSVDEPQIVGDELRNRVKKASSLPTTKELPRMQETISKLAGTVLGGLR